MNDSKSYEIVSGDKVNILECLWMVLLDCFYFTTFLTSFQMHSTVVSEWCQIVDQAVIGFVTFLVWPLLKQASLRIGTGHVST